MPRTSAPGPAWLILPTYNEAANLEPFVEAVRAKLPGTARILIVDDNSPDGTGEIADRLAAEGDTVSVLHRPRKEGLGPAYIAGFRRALAEGAGLVLEMDSDLSHDRARLRCHRGADRLPRSSGGLVEDEPLDRRRGDLARPPAAAARKVGLSR